jgi:hypothetical protein
VCDKDDAPTAVGNEIGGGGFGGKEGCRSTLAEVDAEVDVEGSGLGLGTTDENGEDPICRSFASIIAILSFGFGPSPLPLFNKLRVVGFPISPAPLL